MASPKSFVRNIYPDIITKEENGNFLIIKVFGDNPYLISSSLKNKKMDAWKKAKENILNRIKFPKYEGEYCVCAE
jgi:hypothetical protein